MELSADQFSSVEPAIAFAMMNQNTGGAFQLRSHVPLPVEFNQTSRYIQSPTVIVNPQTGSVYVLYVDWLFNKVWC